jgi:hypothetical protein
MTQSLGQFRILGNAESGAARNYQPASQDDSDNEVGTHGVSPGELRSIASVCSTPALYLWHGQLTSFPILAGRRQARCQLFLFNKEQIMNRRSIVLVLSVFCLFIPGPARAQKDIVVEGQIKIGVHKLKFDTDTVYQFEVVGKNFSPNVTLPDAFLANTADFFKDRDTFRALYMPAKKSEQTVIITPNIFGRPAPEGTLDYTMTVKVMKLDETPLLKKEDKITADDPRYNQAFRKTQFKAYPIKFVKGKTYIIDMVKTVAADKIDPFLLLENPMKQVIMQNDDGGGFPNARIMHRATTDGEYRIIATGLSDFSGLGDFRLTVRTVKD